MKLIYILMNLIIISIIIGIKLISLLPEIIIVIIFIFVVGHILWLQHMYYP